MQEEPKRPEQDEEVHQSIAAHLWENRHKTSADADITVAVEVEGNRFTRALKNFWYHYKFAFVVVMFLLLVGTVCLVQCATKPQYDGYLLYAGPDMSCDKGTTVAAVVDAFCRVMEDYDGNGEKSLSYTALLMMTDAQANDYRASYIGNEENMPYLNTNLLMQNRDLFEAEMMSGYAQICLLDPSLFYTLQEADYLVPLSTFAEDLPSEAYAGYAVRLLDTDFGKYMPGVQDMPADTLLCFRRTGVLNRDDARNAAHKALMRAVLTYTVAE